MEIGIPLVENVAVSEDTLCVDLSDGRSISVPLAWYPRLSHGSSAERKRWRLIGRGVGIHWDNLDEDISVEGLLAGKTIGRKPSLIEQMADETVITNNKAVHKDAPKSTARQLKKSGIFFCFNDLNGAKRLNDWNGWNRFFV